MTRRTSVRMPAFGRRGRRSPAAVLVIAVAAAGCATGGNAAGSAPSVAPQQAAATNRDEAPIEGTAETVKARPPDDGLTDLEERWGVELIGIRRTAANHMLDVRYKVLDAAKAAPLFDRGTKALLIHRPSGAEIPVFTPAKTGPLRSTDPPIEGKVYFMFFSNPGNMIKMGDPVTLKIGDYEASTSVE